jgi:DNA-binding NtrC family response regulator
VENSSFKILVVDDDPVAREVVYSILSKEGYIVLSAKDGFEAIDLIRTEKFDLMITDLVMPGIDGIELISSSLKIQPELATVIITAFATLENALKAIELGAYDYLTKPFKIEEILFLVARCRKMIRLKQENKTLRDILEAFVKKGCLNVEILGVEYFSHIEK